MDREQAGVGFVTWWRVYLNGYERDAIQASGYTEARRIAKRIHGCTCDVIGYTEARRIAKRIHGCTCDVIG